MQRIAGQMQWTVWSASVRTGILAFMISKVITGALGVGILVSSNFLREFAAAPPGNVPEYTSDGQMKLPEHYREWVYLSTGFDMSYNAASADMDHHMFDNVFVNPEAYQVFLKTGTWPDKTMFVLEVRGAEGRGSINQRGNFQSGEIMGLEVHVKDSRFTGNWAFFGFDDSKTAKMTPTTASCYSCHSAHAAVDTTFVQFYPTLLPVAKIKDTLSAGYVKESAEAARQ
ncbi:MAG: cytochrome P460 family protein [Edaphobacter sp.]